MRTVPVAFRTTGLVLVAAGWMGLAASCRRHEPPRPGGAGSPPPSAAPETITTPSGIVMVKVPGGEFLMGDQAGEDDEKPVHPVRVEGFLMDVHEVTQESYQQLTGRNPSKFPGADRPVDQVSWYNAAVLYCNMRSMREGLQPCYDPETGECDFSRSGYRLPTEAEWEYACRAGATTRFSFGDDAGQLARYGWFKENSEKKTHPVGQKTPNAWGLFDMHGNVMEWCHDRYAEDYYRQSPRDNPTGPEEGDECVLRGGSWSTSADRCRAAARYSETPQFADACFGSDNYGFRCVRKVSDPEAAPPARSTAARQARGTASGVR